MGQEALRLKKGDFVAAFAVFAFAMILFFTLARGFGEKNAVTVQAYQNGELLWEQPLNRDGIYEISGEYTNILSISDGKVSFTDSDCPGQDCVHMGVASPSRPLVCLPNRVEIRLVAEGNGTENSGDKVGYDIAVG